MGIALVRSLAEYVWQYFRNGSEVPSGSRRSPLADALTSTAAVVVLTVGPGVTYASKWVLSPSVRAEQTFDSNRRLSSTRGDDTYGSGVTGQLRLRRRTETLDLSGIVLLEKVLYSGGDGLPDEDNQEARLESDYRTERDRFALDVGYRRDSSLSSIREIDQSDDEVDQTEDGDTGLIDQRVRRHRTRVEPEWEHILTERTRTNLTYRYDDVFYSSAEGVNLNDFDRHRVIGAWTYDLSERDAFTVRTAYERFESDDEDDTETDSWGLTLGLKRQFSERMVADVRAGARYSDVDSDTDDGSDTGFLGRASVARKLVNGSISAEVRETLTPSGSGQNNETREFRLKYRRKLLPRWSFLLRSRAFRDRSLGDDTGGDRTYFEATPVLRWDLTQWISVEGKYRYRVVDRDTDNSTEDSHALGLSVRYTPPSK